MSCMKSRGLRASLFFLSASSVALWRPAESSPVGFAGQYVLRICSFEPVVSIVTDIASPRPVVSLQSPSIFCFRLELMMTTCPPTVQLVCDLIDDAMNVSDPSSVFNRQLTDLYVAGVSRVSCMNKMSMFVFYVSCNVFSFCFGELVAVPCCDFEVAAERRLV